MAVCFEDNLGLASHEAGAPKLVEKAGHGSDILRSFSFTGNLQTGLLFVGSVLGHRPAVLRLGKALESGPRSLSSFREYSRVSLAMSKLM
jgi:hypothetical protein